MTASHALSHLSYSPSIAVRGRQEYQRHDRLSRAPAVYQATAGACLSCAYLRLPLTETEDMREITPLDQFCTTRAQWFSHHGEPQIWQHSTDASTKTVSTYIGQGYDAKDTRHRSQPFANLLTPKNGLQSLNRRCSKGVISKRVKQRAIRLLS